jgi:copper transport protein
MLDRRPIRFVLVFLATVALGSLMVPSPAAAHTSLDYTLPTDGASVGVPIDEIVVAFTEPVTLVGNGFAVLDPQNNELEPFAVTDDDTVFRLQLDPPLAGGTVAVKYEVRSADGHVVEGNFVFTVDAPVPTTTTTTTTATTAPATTAPATTPATTPASSTTATSPTPDATAAPTTGAPSATAAPSDEASDDDDGGSGNGPAIAIAVAVALAAGGFLLVRSRTST